MGALWPPKWIGERQTVCFASGGPVFYCIAGRATKSVPRGTGPFGARAHTDCITRAPGDGALVLTIRDHKHTGCELINWNAYASFWRVGRSSRRWPESGGNLRKMRAAVACFGRPLGPLERFQVVASRRRRRRRRSRKPTKKLIRAEKVSGKLERQTRRRPVN